MVVFTCKDDFESMMTCIYDAWAARLGHSNIRLAIEPVGNLELFCEYRHVEKNQEKAEKVIRTIQRKISPELKRKVYNECHQFREFLRSSSLDNKAFFSVIEPKCNVLTLLSPYFEDRMPSEDWMITDKTRMLSVVHPRDSLSFLTPITQEELSYMEEEIDKKDPYIRLWKSFFQSVSIDARKNTRCQRNHLPLWFRKNMTEFQ